MPSFAQPFSVLHLGARVAVVGLILVEDVAERVDVAVRVSVIGDAIGVGGEARGSSCARTDSRCRARLR